MSDHAEILRTGGATGASAGKGVALATVVKTWGSSPRPTGAKLVVDAGGAISSARSRAAASRARYRGGARRRSRTASRGSSISASATSRPGKSASPAAARSRSSSSASNEARLSRRGARREPRRPRRRACSPTSRPGARASSRTATRSRRSRARRGALAAMRAGVARRPQHHASRRRPGAVFVEVFNPPLRCFVVGAVHIAQPLAPMATLADYTSPSSIRAAPSRPRRAFPASSCSTDWPDEALERLKPDRAPRSSTLTHDPKLDDPGAGRGAALGRVLYRRARLASGPMPARCKRLGRAGLRRQRAARASTGRSGSISARCRRPRSRSRSSPR